MARTVTGLIKVGISGFQYECRLLLPPHIPQNGRKKVDTTKGAQLRAACDALFRIFDVASPLSGPCEEFVSPSPRRSTAPLRPNKGLLQNVISFFAFLKKFFLYQWFAPQG